MLLLAWGRCMLADVVPSSCPRVQYGPLGDDGVVPTDLDVCGGHTDDTYPFYHCE